LYLSTYDFGSFVGSTKEARVGSGVGSGVVVGSGVGSGVVVGSGVGSGYG